MSKTLTFNLNPARRLAVTPKLVFELALYALACAMTAGLAVYTAAFLLERASEDLLAGSFRGYQAITLAILVLILGIRFSYVLFLALRHHWHSEQEPLPDPDQWPMVSILVPAYNEEATIGPALETSLAQDYPNFEIIVVDDGSTDRTLEIARDCEGVHDGVDVRVFSKKNAGKWSAHNFALRHAKGDLVLCVDADSRLDRDALRHLVRRLANKPRAAAIAGQVRVRNRDSLLTQLQALEYLTCNGSTRMAQSSEGAVLVVPGPIGLFRRSVLHEVEERFTRSEHSENDGEYGGPYEKDTFAEDFNLSLACMALGHDVLYEPRAISRTKAPETMRALLNQRYRWQRGSIQVIRKLWRRSRDDASLMTPRVTRWILISYAIDLVVIPLWLLIAMPYIVMAFVTGGTHAANLFELFLIFLGANFVLTLCYASTHKDRKRLALVLPFHDIYQTFLLQGILCFVIYDEIRGAPMRWS